MPSTEEIREQVSSETERRTRLAVPAFAGGLLYLLSAIIIANTLKGAPTVGLFQGVAPALSGVAEPSVSPRAAEVKFISHHTFALIVGSLLAAIAVGALTLILLLILDATRFRRPQTWRPARSLVLYGGIAVALVSIGHQIVSAIETHNFASGNDFSAHAVDQALTKGAANLIVDYVSLLAGLALAAGMIGTAVNAMRVGLLPRWMGILGMFTGLLIFLPIGGAELQVVPAFWMVMIGILFIGKWPNAEPPAWAAGEARPWPSRAAGGRARGGAAPATAGGEVVPAPAQPALSSRKRRKRR
ncbi:MAG TPA: hypothetical protein VG366_05625 [Solirubrobacteraceae bacterium]|jgi:hypothetical protein|nr:hypothetical protein [Solirubrobacteraceae bacterium]